MSEPNDTKQSNVPKSANPEPPAIAEEIEAKGNRLEEVATKINVRQWAQHHRSPALPSALGVLSNDIFPIFRRARFADNEDYDIIEPSARLASRLLQRSSLHLTSEQFSTKSVWSRWMRLKTAGKQMHSYLKNTKSINKRDTDLIHASLRELGEFIAFEPKFKAENIARACARTDPKYAVKGVASKVRKASTEHLKGITSVIRYCHIPLRILIQALEKS
jgi:hypothetical protein